MSVCVYESSSCAISREARKPPENAHTHFLKSDYVKRRLAAFAVPVFFKSNYTNNIKTAPGGSCCLISVSKSVSKSFPAPPAFQLS